MSATNRSDARRTNDHYVTPEWAIRRFLEVYQPASKIKPETWLDPCAANGELIRVARSVRPDVSMLGIELRPECLSDLIEATGAVDLAATGDFLALSDGLPDKSIDFVLSNPPYSLAEKFIRKTLRIAKVSAWLLRINAIRGEGRHRLFGNQKPGIFVLPDRPSFTGRGTDATEYAWMVFGDPAVAGRWFMLGETSGEERGEWNKRARLIHPIPNEDTRPLTEIFPEAA